MTAPEIDPGTDFGGEWEPPEGPESIEAMVPQVVAVIVATDPGDWFEEQLLAFARQDYPELLVLVIDAGQRDDLAERVASVLPEAYVRHLDSDEGFAASSNSVLGMVEGASHFVFCHDDVAPDRDAVSVMVEESFRSNAGVVAPKLVNWDDPRRLLHVGMAVDKGGAVVDRVEPGEIDHGQHDSVRDVFLASGGFTLVRADLFAEIGGFDSHIFAMGEDLDLCWRAHVAGARVIVAPTARVRHLELLAGGRRNLPDALRHAMPSSTDSAPSDPRFRGRVWRASEAVGDTQGDEDRGRRRRMRYGLRPSRRRTEQVTLQSLQRRHELRAVLKNYGRFHRARIVPQLLVLSIAEIFIAVGSGHPDRAAAVVHAWRWNLTERGSLRTARAAVQATRRIDDSAIRRMQLRGSARLNAYIRRAIIHGARAARLGVLERVDTDKATRAGREAGGETERSRIARATRGTRALVWAVVALVLLFGSRQLLGSGFPYIGQLVPFASWNSFLHHFVSGWQPSGVGSISSATPGTGVLGIAGLLLFGGTGLLQKIVVLGCIPLGALGVSRLASAFGSVRARLAATVVYLALPLAYDALGTGRWDALLAYAAAPWIISRLVKASGLEPFTDSHRRREARSWRSGVAGRVLALGVIEAVVTSLAPTSAALTLMITAGVALGIVIVGGRSSVGAAGRTIATGIGATVVTVVLLAPWSASILSGPLRWQELLGPASAPASGPTWGSLLHLGVGPIGDSPLAWGFLVAGALPLLVAVKARLAWAGRMWILAACALLFAWGSGRGWLGPFHLVSDMLLVPAAVGIALSIGIGVAAFEEDLSRHRFGWRQGAVALCAASAVVAVIPVLSASVASGRWDMPPDGYGQATSWMARQSPGQFRVLWLGDPAVLPGGSWEVASGLSYALSEDGLPNATSLWPGSSPGAAQRVGDAVRLVATGETVRFGQLLAPYAVRYIAVVNSLGPALPGTAPSELRPLPAQLIPGLATQIDVRQVISQPGFQVFVDDAALPERALFPSTNVINLGSAGSSAGPPLSGWRPVLSDSPGATHVRGRVGRGVLFAGISPPSAWQFVSPQGRVQQPHTLFGYGAGFSVLRPGTVTVRYAGSWRHGLAVGAQVALWVIVLGALSIRIRWLERWTGPRRRRRGGAHMSGHAPSASASHDSHAVDRAKLSVREPAVGLSEESV